MLQLGEGKALPEQEGWELHLRHRSMDEPGMFEERAGTLVLTDLGLEMPKPDR